MRGTGGVGVFPCDPMGMGLWTGGRLCALAHGSLQSHVVTSKVS